MFAKLIRFTLLFVMAIGLCAHGTPVDLRHANYAKHSVDKPARTTSVSKANSRSSTIDLLTGQNSAAHLTSQNYRSSHFFKYAAIFNALTFIAVSCSKYTSRSSQVSFSRFRKLVLFPFHAFW